VGLCGLENSDAEANLMHVFNRVGILTLISSYEVLIKPRHNPVCCLDKMFDGVHLANFYA